MNFKKNVNVFRRKLMQSLTNNISTSDFESSNIANDKIEIKRVLICRPNQRLGNLLLITPLVQEIIEVFPDCKIDIFVKGNLAPTLFANYENVDQIIPLPKKPLKQLGKYIKVWYSIKKKNYDLVINVDKSSSSGRISTKIANSKYKIIGENVDEIQSVFPDYEHIAKKPIYNLRYYLAKIGIKENARLVPSLNLNLNNFEINEGRIILRDLVKNDQKTICLFTNATGEKCYSETWWEEFYSELKTKYPNYNIIEILPIENISRISFKAPTYYSDDVRKIGSLVANTEIFIGADSGVMHLASSVHTPTVGLFSVTNQNTYRPYNKGSITLDPNTVSIQGCITSIDKILNKE